MDSMKALLGKNFPESRRYHMKVTPKSGEVLGDQISDLNNQVFKVHLKNSNIQKGKKRRLSGYLLCEN